jgi:endoglycosylceramidase
VRATPARPSAAVLAVAVVLAAALAAAGCSSGDDSSAASSSTTTTARSSGKAPASRELRPLSVAEQRIVDDRGRQVLLRGANVNALGEYHQADPAVRPTAPVTGKDWDAMAAHGLSVVRLIMSWSKLEPERGRVDRRYLARVRDAVEAANRRGLYVVLDMHQDAWGTSSATPAGTTCPPGTEASIGWDGAPEWATITDGATTCRAPDSQRESAPAVQRAFASFYADTEGIATQLTSVWSAVAAEFAGTPGVAGYDLLNEPNAVEPFDQNEVAYSRWIQTTIDAVRAAESKAGARPTPVFVEPLQVYPLPGNHLRPDLITDDQVVFAPHNYAESIDDTLTVEQTFDIDQAGADELGAALWIGEYGFWDTSAETLSVARRFAAQEDARALGGAWWQWRQTCGDPHSVGRPGATATEDQVHLVTRTCPGDTDQGLTEPFLRILGRAYPRAAPGHITELRSDPTTGALSLTATAATPGTELVVWVPDVEGRSPLAPGPSTGLSAVRTTDVPGGRLLTAATTAADYSLSLG